MTAAAAAQTPTPLNDEAGPIALVRGEPWLKLPDDLYIPPDALEVFLDTFEGPLDLLLYLIRRRNLDILDIPIAEITRQYMEYVELMKDLKLELAAEYLVMAAMLCEIKSQLLLPRPAAAAEDDSDPRAELVRRLQEYERFKQAAMDLDGLPHLGRDCFQAQAGFPEQYLRRRLPEVSLEDVLRAFRGVVERAELFTSHRVEREALSLRERMSAVLARLEHGEFVAFVELFGFTEGRAGVVVTFLAILELTKAATLDLIQGEAFGPIRVRLRGAGDAGAELDLHGQQEIQS